jgi:hypothetical protein
MFEKRLIEGRWMVMSDHTYPMAQATSELAADVIVTALNKQKAIEDAKAEDDGCSMDHLDYLLSRSHN